LPERQKLLSKDQSGDDRHPEEAHHAEREEQQHQAPTAAEAVAPVCHAHSNRADAPVLPAAEDVVKWVAAGTGLELARPV
jgi:hypothetical protein